MATNKNVYISLHHNFYEMQISKQSWHYRYMKWVFGDDNEIPTNLCTYFWLTVLFVATCPLILLGKGIGRLYDNAPPAYKIRPLIDSILGFCLVLAIVGLIYTIVLNFWVFLTLVGLVTVVIGSLIGITISITKLHDKIQDHRFPHRKKQKNLVIARFKAWKDKNCPLLKFKE